MARPGLLLQTLASRCCRSVDPQDRASSNADKAGQLPPVIPAAVRSATNRNLVLGTLLFESGNLSGPGQAWDRGHLEGPSRTRLAAGGLG